MPKISFSTKRLQIDKANSVMVIVIAVATFVAIFSLIASKQLISNRSYQSKVIGAKEKAVDQLDDNLKSRDNLVSAYKQFLSSPTNILGANPAGTGSLDGDNARLILDALPSKYDFPALQSSLEKILTEKNFKLVSTTGIDDEIAQQQQSASSNPQPIVMPFEIGVEGTYDSMPILIGLFENSIRPFQIQKISFSGVNAKLLVTIGANTYYQPEKALDIKTVEVK